MLRRLAVWTLALAACAGSLTSAQSGRTYTLADLQALAGQGAWRELAAHLGDVAPTARTATWQGLAERAALGILEEAAARPDPTEGVAVVEDLLERYPTLARARAVLDRRAEVGLRAFGRCFADAYDISYCNDALTAFVAKDASNLDLAFKAGKLVRLNANHWVAVPYFRRALATPSASRPCNDADVLLAVLSGLRLPASFEAPLADAVAVAGGPCWETLRAPLLAALEENNSYFKANACPVFRAKGALTEDRRRFCEP